MALQDYTKLKNAELEALLKQRSLQTGGKKADMVARLQAADADAPAADAPATAAAAPGSAVAEEAKAEERSAAPASTPSAAVNATATATSESAPGGAAESAAEPTEKKLTREEREAERIAKIAEDEKKYGQGMSATDIDEEIARRKKRAEKYGLPMNAEAAEGIKALERAKKFGTAAATTGTEETASDEAKPIAGLDSALPDRQRKRGREEGAGGRGGKRQRGGGAERQAGNVPAASRQNGEQKGSWMNEADKAKSEARKARFAAAP